MKSFLLITFLLVGLGTNANADVFGELKGDALLFTEFLKYGTYCAFTFYSTPRGMSIVVREDRSGQTGVFDADEQGDMRVNRASWAGGYFSKTYVIWDGAAPVTLRLAHTERSDVASVTNLVGTTQCEILR